MSNLTEEICVYSDGTNHVIMTSSGKKIEGITEAVITLTPNERAQIQLKVMGQVNIRDGYFTEVTSQECTHPSIQFDGTCALCGKKYT